MSKFYKKLRKGLEEALAPKEKTLRSKLIEIPYSYFEETVSVEKEEDKKFSKASLKAFSSSSTLRP